MSCADVPPYLLDPIDLQWPATTDTATVRELPAHAQAEIERLAREGNARMDEGRYVDALAVFRAGIDAIPQPRGGWSATEWFLAGMGDALWHLGCHLNAVPIWRDVLLMNGLGNPFVHLRRGQTLYELGDLDEAKNELARALLLAGQPIFEEEDPKYWNYITGLMRPPEGREGWEGFEGVPQESAMYEWLMDPGKYGLFARVQN